MTKEFFTVTDLETLFGHIEAFSPVDTETVSLADAVGRVSAEETVSEQDLPPFYRSTMDGYAVRAASTYGASDGNPAYVTLKGVVEMGKAPSFSIGPGEAARIATGGMLPEGSDSVVMIEHAESIDDTALEIYRSVAPGQNTIEPGEDFKSAEVVVPSGLRLRPQEIGLLAAFGKTTVKVHQRPKIAVISTGDEVVPVDVKPDPGQIRDVNAYTLAGLILGAGGIPIPSGIVGDDFSALLERCAAVLEQSDMVLISGGSSVGTRDYTIQVLSNLPDAAVMVHGIPISPGKPTILARAGEKMIWGLPGHVVSAMVVFSMIVRPFIDRISGIRMPRAEALTLTAWLNRSIASAQGRVDYIRVKLKRKDGRLWAEPLLGKSALIHTMVEADGLIEIDMNTEGLEKGAAVAVIPMH